MGHAHVHFRVPSITVRDSRMAAGDQEGMRAGAESSAFLQKGVPVAHRGMAQLVWSESPSAPWACSSLDAPRPRHGACGS